MREERFDLLIIFKVFVDSPNNCGASEASTCQMRELKTEPSTQSSRVRRPEEEPRIINFATSI